jgi:hypothetical protein
MQTLRERVQAGSYLVKSHAVQHAIKEGFERKHIVEVILTGIIIEEYPTEQRALVCGKMTLLGHINLYLHVVCAYVDAVYVEFVTAYIPDELQWEDPPFRRRRPRSR